MRVPAYFATPPVVVNDGQDYSINSLQTNLDHKVEQWNKRGSTFVKASFYTLTQKISEFVRHGHRRETGADFEYFFGPRTLCETVDVARRCELGLQPHTSTDMFSVSGDRVEL